MRPVRISIAVFLAVLTISLPLDATAADYYVDVSNGLDSGAGAQSSPWKTIKYAISRISGGDTVHIFPGDYRAEGTITFNNGTGSASNRLSFVAVDAGNKPVTDSLVFNREGYVIDGLHVRDSSGPSIWLSRGAKNILVRNMNLQNPNGQYFGTDVVRSSEDIFPDNTPDISDITLENSIMHGNTKGFNNLMFWGENISILNNDIQGPRLGNSSHLQSDILWVFGNGHLVKGNTFHNSVINFDYNQTPSSSDIMQHFDNGNTSNLTNFIFEGNTIYNVAEHRWAQWTEIDYALWDNVIIRNNVFFHAPLGQFNATDGSLFGTKNMRLYNNTYITGGAPAGFTRMYTIGNWPSIPTQTKNFQYRNNIVYSFNGVSTPGYEYSGSYYTASNCYTGAQKSVTSPATLECMANEVMGNNLYYPQCTSPNCTEPREINNVNPGDPLFTDVTWRGSYSTLDQEAGYAPTMNSSKALIARHPSGYGSCHGITAGWYLEFNEDGILYQITSVNVVTKGGAQYCALDFSPALGSPVQKAQLATIWSVRRKGMDATLTSASAARGAGANLSAIGAPYQFATDKMGNPRSAWDIGAYEGSPIEEARFPSPPSDIMIR